VGGRRISLSPGARTSRYQIRKELAGKETIVNEIVQMVQEKTGLSQEVAQTVVNTVMEYLKAKMPAGMSAGLDHFMGSAEAGEAPTEEIGLMDKAKSMMSGLMGSKDA
jgi:hypothetical protein